jgi:hypothetical protein
VRIAELERILDGEPEADDRGEETLAANASPSISG